MSKKIDLHMHSIASLDGEHSPKELMRLCKRAGLAYVAITDHNSVASVSEGVECAQREGITCIPAIEIDCDHQGVNVHLLGYGIDHTSQVFKKLNEYSRNREEKASYERIKKIQELGFSVLIDDFPEFKTRGAIAPEDIAALLLARPDASEYKILTPFLPGGPRSDNPYANFYWDLFDTGKPCHCPMHWPILSEAIAMITSTGGIPVIAHPGITLAGRFEMLDEMIEMGVEGIEIFSSYHTKEMSLSLYEYAVGKGVLITAGSDYHGFFKPAVALGGHESFVEEKVIIDAFLQALEVR